MEDIKKISDLLDEKFIIQLKADKKKEALEELIKVISQNELITNPKIFGEEIFKREKLMSTGIGLEVAVPHVRHKSIKDFVMAIGINKKGIDFDSIDNKPVKLIFMIGASDKQDKEYIKLLSRLVLRLKMPHFKERLLSADTPEEIYEIIKSTK